MVTRKVRENEQRVVGEIKGNEGRVSSGIKGKLGRGSGGNDWMRGSLVRETSKGD